MNNEIKLNRVDRLRKIFSLLAYVAFNRRRSFIFCVIYCLLSFGLDIRFHTTTLFSASGAIVTLAGLFLNIKLTSNFHLGVSKLALFNKVGGAGVYGTTTMTKEQEKWLDNIFLDEMCGVTFMVAGTLIWAYGNFLLPISS